MPSTPAGSDDGPVTSPAAVPAIAAQVLAAPPRCGGTRLVCVDGPAGSGKTTLAAALAEALGGVPVVHLDDLYEGWEQELGDPLATRIDAWLLVAWGAGLPGMHPRYDWEVRRFTEWVAVPAAPVVILEGCASASRRVRARASLVVWIEAPVDVRLRRGLDRDGEAMTEPWQAWQRHEAAHFAADGTRAAADVLVDGSTGRVLD